MHKLTLSQIEYNLFADILETIGFSNFSINSQKTNLQSAEDILRIIKIADKKFNMRRIGAKEITVSFEKEDISLIYRFFKLVLANKMIEGQHVFFASHIISLFDEVITNFTEIYPSIAGELNSTYDEGF